MSARLPARPADPAAERSTASIALVTVALTALLVGAVYGLAVMAVTLPEVVAAFPTAGDWAVDGHRHFLAAAEAVAGRNPYAIDGFYYSPLGALSMAPIAALGPDGGIWAWMAIKLAVLVWCVADATRGLRPAFRVAAFVVVLSSVFVLDDLLLGNVAIPLGAAMYLAISRRPWWAAVPLGLLLALVAKPFLVPFLLWLVVLRRPSAVAAIGTALAVTVVGVAVLGIDDYRAYLDALVRAGRSAVPFVGNHGLSSIAPALVVPVSILVLAVFALLLWRSRDESALLMWSLFAGLVAAPYVGFYAAVPVAAGLPAFARDHPRRALLLAVVLPLGAVSMVAAAVVGLAIALPPDAIPRSTALDTRLGRTEAAPPPAGPERA